MSKVIQRTIRVPSATATTLTTEEVPTVAFVSRHNILSRPATGTNGTTLAIVPVCPWQASAQSYGTGPLAESDPKLEAQYGQYTHWRCLGATLHWKGSAPNTNPARVYFGSDSDPLVNIPEPSETDFSNLARAETFVVYSEETHDLDLKISGDWKSINPEATYLAYNNSAIPKSDAKLFWDGIFFVGWDLITNGVGLTANVNVWLTATYQFRGRDPTFSLPQIALYNATGVTATDVNSGAGVGPGSVPRFYFDGTYDRYPLLGGGYYLFKIEANIVDPAIAGTGGMTVTVRDQTGADVTNARKLYALYLSSLASGATNVGYTESPYGTGSGVVQCATFQFMMLFHAAPGDFIAVLNTVDAADAYKQMHTVVTRMSRTKALHAVSVLDPTAIFPATI